MAEHGCGAIIITCIDYRFQEYINKWIGENFLPGTYDRGAFAGAAKSLDTIVEQVGISSKLHHTKKVVLINHEDCGAYGKEGRIDQHIKDLKKARQRITKQYPIFEIDTFYLKLDGTFEQDF